LQRWIGAHPSAADWVAWQDRQLSASRARELEAHLNSCETCRAESQRLDETFALFLNADAVSQDRHPRINQGLVRLQEQIRIWRQAQETRIRPATLQAVDTKERWQRLSAELEVYLGPQMTAQLIEAARQSSQEVRGILATARPVLTGLLGEKTAFNVTTQLFKIFAPKRTPA
jgi:anti-sigma factor RsiW